MVMSSKPIGQVMDLAAKSDDELNSMAQADLVASIIAQRNDELANERDTVIVSQSGDSRGQLEQTMQTIDGLGNVIGSQQALWTYYPAGNVDEITTIEMDADGNETSRQVVKHAESGGNVSSTSILADSVTEASSLKVSK